MTNSVNSYIIAIFLLFLSVTADILYPPFLSIRVFDPT